MSTPQRGMGTDRLWAAFLPRPSDLRRGSDRTETVARWLAVALLLLAVPFVLGIGSTHAQQVRDAAALVRATSQPVTATVTRVTASSMPSGEFSSEAVDVTATWGGSGTVAETTWGPVRVGDPMTVWVDATGRRIPAPSSDAAATVDGLLVAFWAFLGVGTAVLGGLALLHRVLDRRRMRDWDEDWALFCIGRSRGVNG